jgi:tetratricopeptide (TPR) repeat protein
MVIGVLILAPSVAQAQTAAVHDTIEDPRAPRSSKMSGHAGSALASGSAAEAAVLAEQALSMDTLNAWAHYRRAAALSELHRTDEAVAEYKTAEQSFASVDDRGRSLALYGRANTLAQAGRCKDAQPVFEEYARFVEKKDPKGAAQARSYAGSCHQSTEEAPATTAAKPEP